MIDPELYPRIYAAARNRGFSDGAADRLAHEAERDAARDECIARLTAAELHSLEADRRFLERF
jgi:hypothetical protein